MSNILPKKSTFEGRKLWFFFAAVAALLTAIVLFVILSQVTSTSTYYVLKSDVAARSQITEDMLSPIVVSSGGAPANALGKDALVAAPLYAKYFLHSGDILTKSNTESSLNGLSAGLPENFVIGTFTSPASFAAGGKIKRGDYVDLIVVQNEQASYFLQHVLVLDATVNLDNSTGSASANADGSVTSAADSSAIRNGIPTLYTVGLSPQDAAKLAVATQSTIYVVLSANQTNDDVEPMDITVDLSSLNGLIENSGAGTDNTFSGKAAKKSSTSTPTATPAPTATGKATTTPTPVPTN